MRALHRSILINFRSTQHPKTIKYITRYIGKDDYTYAGQHRPRRDHRWDARHWAWSCRRRPPCSRRQPRRSSQPPPRPPRCRSSWRRTGLAAPSSRLSGQLSRATSRLGTDGTRRRRRERAVAGETRRREAHPDVDVPTPRVLQDAIRPPTNPHADGRDGNAPWCFSLLLVSIETRSGARSPSFPSRRQARSTPKPTLISICARYSARRGNARGETTPSSPTGSRTLLDDHPTIPRVLLRAPYDRQGRCIYLEAETGRCRRRGHAVINPMLSAVETPPFCLASLSVVGSSTFCSGSEKRELFYEWTREFWTRYLLLAINHE